jgi:YnbE-like lipoprotein
MKRNTNRPTLTAQLVAATGAGTGNSQEGGGIMVRILAGATLAAGAIALSGCISVKAPDKPIVIELNINIKQEVVYRLAGDASQTIDKNKDIF